MRTLKSTLLAGVAAMSLGAAGTAFAQSPQVHVMTVRLPGGGVEQIEYTGNVAPQIAFDSGPAAVNAMPPMPSFFGGESPFAMMDRISAEMDRQMDAMFQQTAAMAAEARSGHSGQLSEAAMRDLPPGSESFSYISTASGNNVCTQSVQITSSVNGGPPQVVSHSSGNCGSAAFAPGMAPSGSGSVSLPTAQPRVARPDMLWTSADGAHPAAGMMHVADLPH